jgi:paraquat-inducible protein B
MSTEPLPKIKRSFRLPLVWVVPVVAAVVAAWMLRREYANRGPEITVAFANGSGIEAGKTMLEYKGVAVGQVREVRLAEDLSGVVVRLRLDRSAATLAREGSEFWLLTPEIGLAGVSGLDTLLSGLRMQVRPGDGPAATAFRGLDRAPPYRSRTDGATFVLKAEHGGAIHARAPVLFRDTRVGEIEGHGLTSDATGVWVRVRVFGPYVDLVRANSVFWNAGGVPMRFSLFGGAEIQTASLGAMLTGAIAFATPDAAGSPAEEGAEFMLHAEPPKDFAKWKPVIAIELHEAHDHVPRGLPAPL